MHILLVDDHPLFSEGLAAFLSASRSRWTLRRAETATAALETFKAEKPIDLVILDLNLPDADGLSTLQALKHLSPDTPVIVLSARDDNEAVRDVLARGGDGYVCKNEAPQRLVHMIESLTGSGPADAKLLTDRQLQILRLLAEGCSNKAIQTRMGIAERTVTAHLTGLFRALGAHSRVQALVEARRRGLVG